METENFNDPPSAAEVGFSGEYILFLAMDRWEFSSVLEQSHTSSEIRWKEYDIFKERTSKRKIEAIYPERWNV